MHMCYERPGVVTALNGGVGYDKWDRDRGGGGGAAGGGGSGGSGGAWASRDREKDRERERQARAHQQMSHVEPDASSLFPAPVRVTGSRDRVSQQIQTKLGDYQVAQYFIDDPSKSIGICAEPPSPAPCPPSRRESEFKKPAHAPQNNGRVHHRPYSSYNKSDGPSSTGAPTHRPPNLRLTNGFQTQNAIDSSQPPIESILKEMKSLPTPLSVIAATPRKEAENKFIFNPVTNKVQENPQLNNTDLKTPITKPGLDNRISNSRSSASPDVINKDLGLSESDDEVAANTHRLGPPLSPINSGSPSSASSSQSDSESESSSAESSTPAAAAVTPPPPSPPSHPASAALTAAATASATATTAPATAAAPATVPAQRSSWGLSNFVPPAAHQLDPNFDTEKDHLRHALADVKGKPSPISEMSDSETSSPSPGASRRRQSSTNRASTPSSDEDTPRHSTTSPRVSVPLPCAPLKRGRPPKARASDERPPKKKRGRPPKTRPPSPPTGPTLSSRVSPPSAVDSDVEPDPPPPQHHHTLQDTKTHIFRKVFTPRKGDEGGGKGGKGGKGKGGKGKGQVTIIEVTAPELAADDEDRRHRERSNERRNEEALARVSPPREPELVARRREADRLANERIQERVSIERTPSERISDRTLSDRISDRTPSDRISDRILERSPYSRIQTERTSNDRIPGDRIPTERTSNDRISIDRPPAPDRTADRIPTERLSCDRLSASDRRSSDRYSSLSSDRRSTERLMSEKLAHERLSLERHSHERLSVEKHERSSSDRPHERLSEGKLSVGRVQENKLSIDRIPESKLSERKLSIERLPESKVSIDRLPESKLSVDRLPENKLSIDRYSGNKISMDRLSEAKIADNKMSLDRLTDSKTSIERVSESKAAVERLVAERYVRAEADLGAGLKAGRGSERLEEAFSETGRRVRPRVVVRVPLLRLRGEVLRTLRRPHAHGHAHGHAHAHPLPHAHLPHLPHLSHHPHAQHQPKAAKRHVPLTEPVVDVAATNHERTGVSAGQTPIYYSYFERLPADTLSVEERNHKYYLEEATRLRLAAEREQEPLPRVMLYLESVLCFVLTGRVLELELDTKGAFTVYRETIAYIKLIDSMPQRFIRASPPDTFNKLDILSLRVRSLLYLRMFKMYNLEVQEYNKIVHEYQQKVNKPACAESVSPLSPSPSPAGSLGSVGSVGSVGSAGSAGSMGSAGSGASASSGYCSVTMSHSVPTHPVPAHVHQALLLLTKYYTFLYVAHELWEQADTLCRLRANQDLFIAVDRKCGPLSLSSTFRHLVQYVRYAMSLLKNASRE